MRIEIGVFVMTSKCVKIQVSRDECVPCMHVMSIYGLSKRVLVIGEPALNVWRSRVTEVILPGEKVNDCFFSLTSGGKERPICRR